MTCSNQESGKYVDFTEDQIKEYLEQLKKLILGGQYIIYRRDENDELDHWGNSEVVEIYIKTNLTQTRTGNDYMIVISFHKLNNPIKYLFR